MWPALQRGEWVVSDRFAAARSLKPGDVVHAILNGRRERIHLVGTAVSPEYVFASKGGAPDDTGFGIWWIDGARMTELFDMQGAFNQAALRLEAGVPERAVLTPLDRLLEPYGSIGAVGRDRQPGGVLPGARRRTAHGPGSRRDSSAGPTWVTSPAPVTTTRSPSRVIVWRWGATSARWGT